MADRRLSVLRAVAKHMSFTKAADELHMTQPAVSFQIGALEKELDARLFDRERNVVTITGAGEIVLNRALRIEQEYEMLRADLAAFNGTVIRKYRPSNGVEGEAFKWEFCYRCAKYGAPYTETQPCQIEAKTLILGENEQGYPNEWRYGEGENPDPLCTAFELADKNLA